jgi:hypothetical protein
VEAQVAVGAAGDGVKRAAAKVARNRSAERVVAAWQQFDDGLRQSPVLADNALVLSVFRLNDVMLTHALWYTTDPETTAWPRKLAALTGKGDKAKKLALAPARAVWARRYAALLQGPARELVEMQEADRFEAMETDALAFESAMAALGGAPPPSADVAANGKATKSKTRRSSGATAASEDARKLAAANAASALGLYQKAPDAGTRTPVAVALAGDVKALEQKLEGAGAQAKVTAGGAGANARTAAQSAVDQLQESLRSLRGRLLARGPRLI